jgi:hypothetical protein
MLVSVAIKAKSSSSMKRLKKSLRGASFLKLTFTPGSPVNSGSSTLEIFF